jgi:hypothetical protein
LKYTVSPFLLGFVCLRWIHCVFQADLELPT